MGERTTPPPPPLSPNSDFTHHKCTILPLNEPAGAGRVSGVTGCRGSVARSRGLTLAVLRRRFHPPTINFPRLHLSTPTTPARRGILSLASKTGTSIPNAAKSLSLQTAAGGAAPGPVQRGARADTHKGPSPPLPSRGGNQGADRTRRRAGSAGGPGTRPLRHPIRQIRSPATALPASPLRQARGAGGPTSSSSPSSSAATLPSRRLMAPARPVRSPAARRAQNRSTPGDRRAHSEETGRRRHKDAPQAGGARGRAGPPSPRAPDPPHGRALAGSEPVRSVGRAAGRGDGCLGAETARCLLSWRRPSCLTSTVLGRFIKGRRAWGGRGMDTKEPITGAFLKFLPETFSLWFLQVRWAALPGAPSVMERTVKSQGKDS